VSVYMYCLNGALLPAFFLNQVVEAPKTLSSNEQLNFNNIVE